MKSNCLILMTVFACPAWAQSDTTFMPEGSTDITLNLGAALIPRAEGSKKTQVIVLPGATVQWSNGIFLEPGTLGMQLSEVGNLRYGPLLDYGIKNQRSDEPSRKNRLDLQAGGFASYQLFNRLGVHSRVLYGGSDDNRGVQLNAGATFSMPLTPHQRVALSTGAVFVDKAYMQSYFGVTEQQARAGRRPVYDAAGGLKNVYVSGAWSVELTHKYALTTGMNVNWLGNSPAASPLTNANQGYSVFTQLSYHY